MKVTTVVVLLASSLTGVQASAWFCNCNSPSLGTTWAKRVCSQLGSNVRDATLDDYDANGNWVGRDNCEFNPSVFPMDKSPGSTGDWTKAKCQASYGTEYNSFCQWGASSPW
ncbi:hypothetical protein GTA08_BOTSDO04275 [Botryosphaeria dothidea]|uniref:Secreted protein n=1 Tax=Botryosphaeria dothidea TaxID=55169 RepID=A0A8H4N2C0_9PEZI|nr:hypothetical protein GTA08_BOTSDO04275 [Botryosphaeria dothidea]